MNRTLYAFGRATYPDLIDVYDEVANRDESLCHFCHEENAAYWAEMWRDYYVSQM